MSWKGLELNSCPSCSSKSILSAGRRKDGATVSRCSECGLGFLNPMPTDDEISDMYKSYYSRGDGTGYVGYRVDWHGTGLDRLLWDALTRFSPDLHTMLDVGCAYGTRVLFFNRRGLKAKGIDISNEAVEEGVKKGLDLSVCRFEDFRTESLYDAMTMIDFVEHLASPGAWSSKLGSLTRTGSLLAILTPDFDCYGDYGEKWIGYNLSFEHVLFYNRRALARVLKEAGFTPLFCANVKSAGPVVSDSESERHRIMGRLLHLVRGERLYAAWRAEIERLRWRQLLSSTRRENSLLVVAKRL